MDEKIQDLPPKNQRINGTWYMFEGRKRYWKDNNLKCEHKKQQSCCDICKNNKNFKHRSSKRTKEDYINLGIEKGYKYIADKIPGSINDKLIEFMWECKEEHKWSARYHDIKSDHECPYCARKAPKTLENYINLGIEKGYKYLLDHIPKNSTSKTQEFMWECQENHRWSARYTDIERDHGCPYCSGKAPKTLNNYIDLGIEKGYKYIANKIPKTTKDKLEENMWECKENHTWSTCYGSILGGSGCPICVNRSSKIYQDYVDLAKENNLK